jgi:pheromone shutdown protein TraB
MKAVSGLCNLSACAIVNVQVLREVMPGVHSALVVDRDAHMAEQVQSACKELRSGSSGVVAVIGLAHLDGLERILMERNLGLP